MVDQYVQEVRSCLKNGCYNAALALTLILPDICGMAEWPDKTVPERYVDWYDSFACVSDRKDSQSPRLSGEMVYNLRNTFLHQGEPTIDSKKVKEARNQVNEFELIYGESDILFSSSTVISKDADIRRLKVNVWYLCNAICDGTEKYDRQKRKPTAEPPKKKTATSAKKPAISGINEQQLRTLFGQVFREQKYKSQKEEILTAVLTAKTKVELNNHLTRLFPGQEVKEILKRLKPLTGMLPGK